MKVVAQSDSSDPNFVSPPSNNLDTQGLAHGEDSTFVWTSASSDSKDHPRNQVFSCNVGILHARLSTWLNSSSYIFADAMHAEDFHVDVENQLCAPRGGFANPTAMVSFVFDLHTADGDSIGQ